MQPPKVKGQFQLGHFHLLEVAGALLFTAVVFGVFGATAGLLLGWPTLAGTPVPARILLYLASLFGAGCVTYGIFIEPYHLSVTKIELISPKIKGDPIRLVHLSDLHVRRWSPIDEDLIWTMRELKPAAILLSGDYTAFPTSMPAVRRMMKELNSIAPTYCSRGNGEYRRPRYQELLAGSGATWLLNASRDLSINGSKLTVTGVDCGDEAALWEKGKDIDPAAFSVCLYHYPDMVPELDRLPYDLMLCGHTHGGQICLPYIGPVISTSRPGRRYSHGLFRSGEKAAYVSRGIGCRSYGLPRMRFLCPPEAVLITLKPEA